MKRKIIRDIGDGSTVICPLPPKEGLDSIPLAVRPLERSKTDRTVPLSLLF